MFKEYGELSTILYQHTKPIGHSVDGDIEYYTNRLRNVSARVLEAGVGTGRMLIPLIKQRFTVDGVDLSADMLAQCKINLSKHEVDAKLYQQDLAHLSLPNKYGAIIMPTGSFCLLPKSIIGDVLASFYSHLDKGGMIILDLIFPSDFRPGEVETRIHQMDDDEGILVTSISQDINWQTQKTSYVQRYELVKNGSIQKAEISNFSLYWYGIWEFEMMLKSAGFAEIDRVFGYGNADNQSLVTFSAKKL